MPIAPSDVSVVIQGPVGDWTAEVVTSAHRHLPGCEVILSTWRGTCPPEVAADVVLVESDDPGPGPSVPLASGTEPPFLANTRRMLMSSRNGLRGATRPYALKLRSDSPLVDDGVLQWDALARSARNSLFSQRLLTCSVATRPRTTAFFLFHPSDCVHFGPRADVLALWSIPDVDEEENVGWWRRQHLQAPHPVDVRYFNEQLLWLGFLRQHGRAPAYPHAGATPGAALLKESERSIVENFVVLEPWQLGVSLPKLASDIAASPLSAYLTFDDWLALDAARA